MKCSWKLSARDSKKPRPMRSISDVSCRATNQWCLAEPPPVPRASRRLGEDRQPIRVPKQGLPLSSWPGVLRSTAWSIVIDDPYLRAIAGCAFHCLGRDQTRTSSSRPPLLSGLLNLPHGEHPYRKHVDDEKSQETCLEPFNCKIAGARSSDGAFCLSVGSVRQQSIASKQNPSTII